MTITAATSTRPTPSAATPVAAIPAPTEIAASNPIPALPVAPPSVHIRALLTWLAIFPMVSIGMLALNPLWSDWHPVLRALLLTGMVVPLAVYLVVPQLLRGRSAVVTRRNSRP